MWLLFRPYLKVYNIGFSLVTLEFLEFTEEIPCKRHMVYTGIDLNIYILYKFKRIHAIIEI